LPNKLVGQYVFGLINITVYILAPGTRVRAGKEIQWYLDFQMLTPVDKVFQAVNWTNRHYITASNLLFFIFTVLIFAVYFNRYRKENTSLVIASSLPALFCLGRLIPFNVLLSRVANYQHGMTPNFYQDESTKQITIDIEKSLDKLFYNTMSAGPNNINTGWSSLLPSILTLTVLLFAAVLLMNAFSNKALNFFTTILYLAALTTGYIMAISPTIFASGSRVFFIGDVLILLIIGILLKEIITDSNIGQTSYFKKMVFGMVVFAGIMVLAYIVDYANRILCL
jgi:hypothetical protein